MIKTGKHTFDDSERKLPSEKIEKIAKAHIKIAEKEEKEQKAKEK